MTHKHYGLTPTELGTVEAVLLNFNKHQLPRLLNIKERVDKGEVLNVFDVTFLEEAVAEVRACEHFADSHEEYQLLIAEVADLFDHISHKAAQNEKASDS